MNSITLQDIYSFGLIVALLITIYLNAKKMREPHDQTHDVLEQSINDMKSEQMIVAQKLENDFNNIEELSKDLSMINKCMLQLLNHEIDGNGVKEMKKTRDELQAHILKN